MPPAIDNRHGLPAADTRLGTAAIDNRRGILAMLTAMTLFSGNDTLTKIATESLPTGQIMAVRGFFAVVFTLVLVAALGEGRHLRELASQRVLGRGLLEASIAFIFLTALGQLPLANITAILQATPIILTLIAVVLGLETVRWRRWTAIIVGFVGVVLIVKPSPEGFNVYAVFALVCAALVAVRDLITRSIAAHVPNVVVTLSATSAVTALGFALSTVEDWVPLTGTQISVLAGAAILVTLGNLAVVKAFRVGEMSVVSPFRYSVILTSLVLGYIVFGELPDAISVAGIVLIVGSGIYTIHREQVRRRALAAASPGTAR